ncbi:MAG: NADH-quinone oxidoreductase subunit L [Ekhidna sp.]
MMFLLINALLFMPLVGGGISFFIKSRAGLPSTIGVSISLLISIYLLVSDVEFVTSLEWLPEYRMNMLVDKVSLLLIFLVTLISMLIHVFSKEYMKDDDGRNRYFFKLGFFTFSMIGLLLADHLILLFVFWELVGLASYLLIGFWYSKEGVPSSARLAFMVNRVADVALLAGILLLNKQGLNISNFEDSLLFLPSLLIAIGAFGKSAQLPFSGWLTKAMVGPTPVSALIHAATMVAAGVYLLFRVSPFMHANALVCVALVGTLTACYGGLCALMQHDIKKVLAYSTISQLGYMVMGIGVGAQDASLFHLFTHAFFKAGLFLGAGAIIHFMHYQTKEDAQDMRNMGGLRMHLPWTYKTFLICALALAGIPLFSGFMSKDGIIIAAWEWASELGTWAYVVPDIALITAFLTAFYVGRMIILIFWGKARLLKKINSFSEARAMKIPLIVLAIGSTWMLYNWNPIAHTSWLQFLWGAEIQNHSDHVAMIVALLSLLMAGSGLLLAYSFFKPGSAYNQRYSLETADRFPAILKGFYLTSLYHELGKGTEKVTKALSLFDHKVVDGAIHLMGVGGVVLSKVIALADRFLIDGPVNFVGYLSKLTGKLLADLSSRDLQTQLTWLLLGVILILSWILFF